MIQKQSCSLRVFSEQSGVQRNGCGKHPTAEPIKKIGTRAEKSGWYKKKKKKKKKMDRQDQDMNPKAWAKATQTERRT